MKQKMAELTSEKKKVKKVTNIILKEKELRKLSEQKERKKKQRKKEKIEKERKKNGERKKFG